MQRPFKWRLRLRASELRSVFCFDQLRTGHAPDGLTRFGREHQFGVREGDRDALVLETLMAFKRAGASGVLTYHAPLAARLLNG